MITSTRKAWFSRLDEWQEELWTTEKADPSG